MKQLKSTITHIRRSPYQAFSVVFLMAQTFFVVTFFSFVILGSSKVIAYFESIPQVTAFFKNEAKQEDITTLQKELEENSTVAQVEFISKEQGLQIYKEQNKDDPLILELVTADILPAALKVSANKIEDLGPISTILKSSQFVERVIYQKDVVEVLSSWTSALRKIGIAVITVLAVDTIFIMVIVLSIRISQKRDEIEILRLLGATNWYIRMPFVYEGMLYGIVGAFIGWAIGSLLFLYATPFLSEFLKGISLFPISPFVYLYLLIFELALSVILAAFASFLAVLRYLK